MSKKKRVTKNEKERRILTVQGWIIDGAQDDFMLRQMRDNWDLSGRQAKRYLEYAYNRWKPGIELDIENRRAAKIAELKQIKRSLKSEFKGTPSGINAILRVEKQIIKLEQLEPPKQHKLDAEIKGNVDVPIHSWLKNNNKK